MAPMYFVKFNAPRVVVYTDPKAFERRALRWLSIREGENSYFLGLMSGLAAGGPVPGQNFFTVEEDNNLLAAGVRTVSHSLCLTWATHEVIETLVDFLGNAQWNIQHIHGPGHVAGYLGWLYAQRTGRRAEMGRAERVYQLARNYYALPSEGHLAVATPEDRPLVREWLEGFIEEADFEMEHRSLDAVIDALIAPRVLYFWKSPQPVSMAAWVAPTPHGASINFVYTPPEFRGQGYGKAVSAALGAQMLASGLRYCFILTDVNDARTNALYQSIGARTLCEFTRCSIFLKDSVATAPSILNVATSTSLR
jgi:uncharacterized protein